ncbi:hypothetical protein AXF42_Ash020284 [Apostasia shenzhenica]|uniref:Uncharacterized protein n=1 Tax=Apostasia shenzhenica TaxID=1088818 RepID=A0A2H9ZSX6_9ASPA|nr:hypothetical protein AXF42_Ash020284 [Apostasia shenzhenica]
MENATTIAPRDTHMNFMAVVIECNLMSWSRDPVYIRRQVTAIELTIAMVSEMRKTLKASFLARTAIPASLISLL